MNRSIFFSADWHIGHSKVLEFDRRPFRDLNHMHQTLINNYNSTVPENGLCYFLGDMGFGGKDVLKSVMDQLNGSQKICIKGNHDKSTGFLYDIGFDLVLNSAMFTLGRENITMSHCPLRGVFRESMVKPDGTVMKGMSPDEMWHGEKRHTAFSIPDFGQYHLHGHTHKQGDDVKAGRQWDVGVPGNNYRPVSISAIESWIARMDK